MVLNFKKASWELESVGIDIPTVALASWDHPLQNQALISNQPNDFLYTLKNYLKKTGVVTRPVASKCVYAFLLCMGK